MITNIAERYPYIDGLMMGFINQDAAAMAGSTSYYAMIKCYIDEVDRDTLASVLDEIEAYRAEHGENLTTVFAKDFPYGYRLANVEKFFTLLRGAICFKLGAETRSTADLDDMATWDVARIYHDKPTSTASKAEHEQRTNELPIEELEEVIAKSLLLRAKLAEGNDGRGSDKHRHYLEMLAELLDHSEHGDAVISAPSESISTREEIQKALAIDHVILVNNPKR